MEVKNKVVCKLKDKVELMCKYLSVLVTGLVLLVFLGSAVSAVKEDVAAGVPIAQVIEEALARGETIDDIVRQAMRAAPEKKRAVLAAALQVSPADAPQLVEIGIANGIPPQQATMMGVRASPDQATEVLRVGVAADESNVSDILRSAIRAGVDPMQLTPLINEFVINNMKSLIDKDARSDGKRLLTAEEILSSLYDSDIDGGAVQQSDLPLLVLPPVNGGSDRLPSPN